MRTVLSAGRTVYCPLEDQYTVRWKISILSAGRTEYCQLEEQNTVCWKNKILSAGRTEYCPLENCRAPLRLYSPIQGPKDQYRYLVSDCSIPRRLTDNMNPLAAWYMTSVPFNGLLIQLIHIRIKLLTAELIPFRWSLSVSILLKYVKKKVTRRIQ